MASILAEEDGAGCGTTDRREGARFSAPCRPAELEARWYRAVLAPLERLRRTERARGRSKGLGF